MENEIILQRENEIVGRYKLLERVHNGGEGRIVRAQDLKSQETVILKFYNDQVADWDALETAEKGAKRELWFLERAKKNQRSDVPRVLNHGFSGALEEPVLVMGEIKGRTLADIIAAEYAPNLEEGIQTMEQLGETLTYAHQEFGLPFIHRDVKPENIMVTDDGRIVVLDWSTGKSGGSTTINTMISSLYYTSPEVAVGKTATPSSDVFSLGRVLQHYLLGEQFVRKDGKVVREDFKGFPELIVAAMFKATAEKKEDRYGSVDAFVQELKSGLEKERSENGEGVVVESGENIENRVSGKTYGELVKWKKVGEIKRLHYSMWGTVFGFGGGLASILLAPPELINYVGPVSVGSVPAGTYLGYKWSQFVNGRRRRKAEKAAGVTTIKYDLKDRIGTKDYSFVGIECEDQHYILLRSSLRKTYQIIRYDEKRKEAKVIEVADKTLCEEIYAQYDRQRKEEEQEFERTAKNFENLCREIREGKLQDSTVEQESPALAEK